MMPAEGISDSLLLDKNGNALKGTARQARIDKLERSSKPVGKKKAAKAAKATAFPIKAAKAAEAGNLEARIGRIEDSVETMAKAMAALTAAFTS